MKFEMTADCFPRGSGLLFARFTMRIEFRGLTSKYFAAMVHQIRRLKVEQTTTASWQGVCIMLVALVTTGCSGLKQFPDTASDFTKDLTSKDPAYAAALEAISKPNANAIAVRNRMIDERLRVIDIRFAEFQRALALENVTTNFGVAVAQVVIGGTGALVHETTSQILSAVSGALAGSQQAYHGKQSNDGQGRPKFRSDRVSKDRVRTPRETDFA